MDGDSIELRDLALGDAGWVIARHAELNGSEEGHRAACALYATEGFRNGRSGTDTGFRAGGDRPDLGDFALTAGLADIDQTPLAIAPPRR